ncbi:MAG: sigma-70 family RNA polymerase sigma factor [Elusimicrobia bacterium]|nr:sigma-70 family RNA polymerase sigma factor [Elusimicrobiota bacterium]
MPESESALISRSREGDPAAFESLVRRYEDRIYRLAKNVCAGAPAEADDVYQETFLTAFKKLRTFRGGSGLGTWLYRIASNLCFMRLRSNKRRPFVAALDLPSGEGLRLPADSIPTPEQAAGKRELAEAVARALKLLPVDYRLVLTLRDVEGLSNEETAKVLKVSVAAVKSRLHRGRLFMRERLAALSEGAA